MLLAATLITHPQTAWFKNKCCSTQTAQWNGRNQSYNTVYQHKWVEWTDQGFVKQLWEQACLLPKHSSRDTRCPDGRKQVPFHQDKLSRGLRDQCRSFITRKLCSRAEWNSLWCQSCAPNAKDRKKLAPSRLQFRTTQLTSETDFIDDEISTCQTEWCFKDRSAGTEDSKDPKIILNDQVVMKI